MEVTIDTLEKRFSDETTKLEERLHAFEKKNYKIIKHMKMNRDKFAKLSCKKYFTEEI